MNDWEQFLGEAPWLAQRRGPVVVGEPARWNRGEVPGLPRLSGLLEASTVTPVSTATGRCELLTWGPPDQRRGWLIRPPHDLPVDLDVPPIQRRLWGVCGGILEQFREPESWWLNQDEVLTVAAAQVPLPAVLEHYRWLWSDAGLEIPIDASDFYVVAREANGNLTLAHRTTGRLLLFAADHAFEGVSPLPGCPDFSLVSIDALPDLTSWIEACAVSWHDQ